MLVFVGKNKFILSTLVIGLMCFSIGSARQKPVEPIVKKPEIRLLPTRTDLFRLAYMDAMALDPQSRLYTRYVDNRSLFMPALKTLSLVLAWTGRGYGIVRPVPVAGGLLIRVDLRHYTATEQDLLEWIGFWEQLAFDPYYSLIVTRDTLDFVKEHFKLPQVRQEIQQPDNVKSVEVEHPGGVWKHPTEGWSQNLKPGRYKYDVHEHVDPVVILTSQLDLLRTNDIDAVRFNAPHLEKDLVDALQRLLSTQAPIVDHMYFKHRAFTSIKGKRVYQAVFGGLYYELRGIKKAKDVLGKDTKATDLDLFFEGLGIGNIKAGVTAEILFDKLRSDQRVAIFRSGVTGKPREVDIFNVPFAKEGSATGSITGDPFDEDIDTGDWPYANLLNPRRKAREGIFPHRTGTNTYVLFNEQGELQDEVPFNIANDHLIPAPYTRRLECGYGCMRCHGSDGSDGWKPIRNDVKTLLEGKLDVFDDKGQRVNFRKDIVDRLGGLYLGDFSKQFRRNRDDIAEVTLKATGPWPDGRGDQSDAHTLAVKALVGEYEEWRYTDVDARRALLDEGIDCPKENALELFSTLHPPELRATIEGVVLEDPNVAAIKAGIAIPRTSWLLSFSFAMERCQRSPVYAQLVKENSR